MAERITIKDFAAKIKAKYPDYAKVPDLELTRRIVAKYPQYQEMLDAPVPPSPLPAQEARVPLATRAVEGVRDFVTQEGPMMAGAAIGGTIGAPAGPVGVGIGASTGAVAGESIKQLMDEMLGTGKIDVDRLRRAIISGPMQEMGGMVAAKFPQVAGKALTKSFAGSEKQMERVLAPTTRETKFLAQKVAPEMAERRLTALTKEQLQAKAAQGRARAGAMIDKAFADIPKNVKMKTQPIVNALEEAKKEFVVDNVSVLPAAVDKLDELKAVIQQFGPAVSADSLRKTRQVWDMVVDKAGGFGGKDLTATSQIFAQKQAADAIRRQIGKVFPDIKTLNAEFNFWANMDDILQARIQREAGRSLSLTDLVSGGTGIGVAAGGGPLWAVFAPAVIRFAQSTFWRTSSAAAKETIADLIEKGMFTEAARLAGQLAGSQLPPK